MCDTNDLRYIPYLEVVMHDAHRVASRAALCTSVDVPVRPMVSEIARGLARPHRLAWIVREKASLAAALSISNGKCRSRIEVVLFW